jgi:PPOX class probable F420-dependent enzyme
MTVLSPLLREFLDSHCIGVLATDPPQGRPRQSVVYYVREEERLLASTLADRLKARDVRGTGWASLCVMGQERPFPSATFSGAAEIITEGIGPATAQVAQRFMGAEEPPEPQSDEALAAVGRVILALAIERVTAVSHLAAPTGRRAG